MPVLRDFFLHGAPSCCSASSSLPPACIFLQSLVAKLRCSQRETPARSIALQQPCNSSRKDSLQQHASSHMHLSTGQAALLSVGLVWSGLVWSGLFTSSFNAMCLQPASWHILTYSAGPSYRSTGSSLKRWQCWCPAPSMRWFSSTEMYIVTHMQPTYFCARIQQTGQCSWSSWTMASTGTSPLLHCIPASTWRTAQ